jgi:four helix bundle protein
MAVLSFKELIVWQKSMTLAQAIYRIGIQLPSEEKFGLISQMRRCAVSIPSNIAEGNKRSTAKDYVQFLRMASGSAAELETQLLLAKSIYNVDVSTEIGVLEEIQKMLEAMKKKILKPVTYSL